MSIITSLAGVSRKESKRAMRDLLLFEGKLALVSENKDVLSSVCSGAPLLRRNASGAPYPRKSGNQSISKLMVVT